MRARSEQALSEMIGKVISGVVVADYGNGDPRTRFFLTFSDGTAFELWEGQFGLKMASSLDEASRDELIAMLGRRAGAEIRVFQPPHEDSNNPQKDLLTDHS